MHWITIIWAMISSACLTLTVVHGLVWRGRHNANANGLFALSAIATAIYVGCELWMMRAVTPTEYGTALRWAHVPLWLLMVSLVGFVRLYMHAGRLWLAWASVGLRTLALLLNFSVGVNLNYSEITAVNRLWMLGEQVSIASGVTNPAMVVGQASALLLLIFVADASLTVLRRGERRKALIVGGSIMFFVLAATAQAMLALTGIVRMPVTISIFYVGVVIAMGSELSRELRRSMQLSDDLHESEERLSLTVDGANLGLWTQDLVHHRIWATEKWRSLFGFTKLEPLDLDHILQRLHPGDRDAVSEIFAKTAAAGGSYETEFRIVLPDGRIRWIGSRGQVESDVEHNPILIRAVSLDITERRRSEMEARELRQNLAHAGRVTMMGLLASSLAHELNQPLGAILRNAEAAEMLLQSPTPDLEELRAIIADIHKDDRRAGDVIDRLRALLKRRDIESRALGVGSLVDEVVDLVHSDAISRRVKLATNVPTDLPQVRGDRVHLLQVLLNLTINGMDAVDAELDQDRRVTLNARLDGTGMVELAVSDCGHGVPQEELGHLFDPFFSTKANGMGMGLPISRTIVEAHGGRLWVENNTGRGATFRFTLSPSEPEGAA